VFVLIAEIIGLTAVAPYGFLLWLHTQPSGSKGLPVDDGRVVLPPAKRFNVHILVPCYKVRGLAARVRSPAQSSFFMASHRRPPFLGAGKRAAQPL
jgi:hypothetical protein